MCLLSKKRVFARFVIQELQKCKKNIKKFISDIIYYKFIEKSRIFYWYANMFFSRFGTPAIRKFKKSSVQSVGKLYILFYCINVPTIFANSRKKGPRP